MTLTGELQDSNALPEDRGAASDGWQQVMGGRRDFSVELPTTCAGSSCDAALVCFHLCWGGLFSRAAVSETPIIL